MVQVGSSCSLPGGLLNRESLGRRFAPSTQGWDPLVQQRQPLLTKAPDTADWAFARSRRPLPLTTSRVAAPQLADAVTQTVCEVSVQVRVFFGL